MSGRPNRQHLLVFQHLAIGHPGVWRDFLAADGVTVDTVRLDAGESIPVLAGYDGLVVMGGAQDVWQEAEHPWLPAEKAAIREAVVDRGMAYLGICLGHQLLADALGGEVGPTAAAEVGVFEVSLDDRGRRHPLFAGLPARMPLLQWHAAEIRRPPAGASVLASSARCAVQAMAWGDRAFGLQFHAEVDRATLADWLSEPTAREALAEHLGADGPARFDATAKEHMAALNRVARQIYDNFMAVLATGS